MPRKPTGLPLRGKLNLTIHPDIRAYADELALKRRRSISQLFEELIEAEWMRQHQQPAIAYLATPYPGQPQPYLPQVSGQPHYSQQQ